MPGSCGAQNLVDEGWQVNEWVKKAVVLYFPMRTMEVQEVGPFQFHDKMALEAQPCRGGGACGSPCDRPVWRVLRAGGWS